MKEAHPQDQTYLKELIVKAKNGDVTAFETLYTTYYTPLYRYVLVRIKNKKDAEDITQNVFIKIWNALPGYNTAHTSPLSLFFTIARNTLIDYFRKKSSQEIVSDEVIAIHAQEHGVHQETRHYELSQNLKDAITKLSKEQQEIITLFYTNDLTYTEIAEITGKREDAIRQMHSRALHKLRTLYTQDTL